MPQLDEFLTIPEAHARLMAGNVIIFPTDTVWGVGALWKNQRGVEKLYQVKQREDGKPMAMLVAEIDQLQDVGIDFDAMSPNAHRAMVKLMKALWPGGLTMILPWPAKPINMRWSVPTLGVRIPNHTVIQDLLRKSGPLIQSSAMVSGGLTPNTYDALDQKFIDLTGGVLAGESGGVGGSTVVDLTGPDVQIIRAGCIPVSQVEQSLID